VPRLKGGGEKEKEALQEGGNRACRASKAVGGNEAWDDRERRNGYLREKGKKDTKEKLGRPEKLGSSWGDGRSY